RLRKGNRVNSSRYLSPIAIALMVLGIVFTNAGDSSAKGPLFAVRLKQPTITITHQSSSPGTCFGGTTEPCDVFQFTSKFTCTDCAQDLANNFGIFFEISTSSICDSDVYSTFAPLPNMSIQTAGNKSTYMF